MFEVFRITNAGGIITEAFYPTFDDAADAAEDLSNLRPHAIVDVREVDIRGVVMDEWIL